MIMSINYGQQMYNNNISIHSCVRVNNFPSSLMTRQLLLSTVIMWFLTDISLMQLVLHIRKTITSSVKE